MITLGDIEAEISKKENEIEDLRLQRLKVIEEEAITEMKQQLLKEQEEYIRRIHAVMETPPYSDMVEKIKTAGVSMEFTKNGIDKPRSYSMDCTFMRSSEKIVVSFEFFVGEGNYDNCGVFYFFVSEHVHFNPLSSKNQAKWVEASTKINLPGELRDVARFTEFFMGLCACNIHKCDFDEIYPDLLDTEERDGAVYYTGHGGGMKQMFEIKFK